MINVKPNLTDLPEEIIVYLAGYLDGVDVVRLSHVNRRFYVVLDEATALWRKLFEKYKFCKSAVISKNAKLETASVNIRVNPLKIKFILYLFNENNWKFGRFRQGPVFDSYSYRFCYQEFNQEILASIEWNWRTDSSMKLHIWNALDKSTRLYTWQRNWAMQGVMEIRSSCIIQNFLVCGNVAILHLRNYLLYRYRGSTHQALFAVSFEKPNQLVNLWQDCSNQNGVWRVGIIGRTCLYKLDIINKRIFIKDVETGKARLIHDILQDLTFDQPNISTSEDSQWWAVNCCSRDEKRTLIYVLNTVTHNGIILETQNCKRVTGLKISDSKLLATFEKNSVVVWNLKTGTILISEDFGQLCQRVMLAPNYCDGLDVMTLTRKGYSKTISRFSFSKTSSAFELERKSGWISSQTIKSWKRTISVQLIHNAFVICYVDDKWVKLAVQPCTHKSPTVVVKLIELRSQDETVRFRSTPTSALVFAGGKMKIFDFSWNTQQQTSCLA